MKQTPELLEAERQMRPGMVSREGFLDADARPLRRILEEDDARVAALGLTHQQIADRLRYFADHAKRRLGARCVVDNVYQVQEHEVRGRIHCPWPHPSAFVKNAIFLQRLDTGEELRWSDLHVHMIEAHGFYEGEGSAWRLAPEKLKRVLGLGPIGNPDCAIGPAPPACNDGAGPT